jgi:8-oxo-dGTP pyrophosphatase MutT (NUDIX family)
MESADPLSLIHRIGKALSTFSLLHGSRIFAGRVSHNSSAVLFLIGNCRCDHATGCQPCLILNKRSISVRQPGDLCFPGGGLSPRLDSMLARLLLIPWFPLRQWTAFPAWRKDKTKTKTLSLLLAAALRESWEEMRLNPLRVRFLGILPWQQLLVYNRRISPMVGWLETQVAFKINWEVQRIVRIPLISLLDEKRYGRFQPKVGPMEDFVVQPLRDEEFPCYVHEGINGRELLWGATFRMVEDFLRIVFGFKVPPLVKLPQVDGVLSPHYPQGTHFAQR